MSTEKNIKIAEFIGFQKTDLGWYDAEEVLLPMNLDSNTFNTEDLLFDKSWDWFACVMGVLSLSYDRDNYPSFDVLCYTVSDSIVENDLVGAYTSLLVFIDSKSGIK